MREKQLHKKGAGHLTGKGDSFISIHSAKHFKPTRFEQITYFKQATQTLLQAYATTRTYSKKEHSAPYKYWE